VWRVTAKFKVCLIGATGVGKTSLVSRYVHSVFSDLYRTTIGVKIETTTLRRDGADVQLVIWDISGEDEFQSVQPAYLAGAAAYLVVIDGTRRHTADTASALIDRMRPVYGRVPYVVAVNKADLASAWEVPPEDIDRFRAGAAAIVRTSARSGAGVAEAFARVVDAIFAGGGP
jgi:small GTP-binding protein